MKVNGIPATRPDLATLLPAGLKPISSMNAESFQQELTQSSPLRSNVSGQTKPLREAFTEFVGQTFFGELIKSYRSTQQPSAYFHGGRAEQIFQGQLDQVLTESLSQRTADTIADPMFELFMAKRL